MVHVIANHSCLHKSNSIYQFILGVKPYIRYNLLKFNQPDQRIFYSTFRFDSIMGHDKLIR